MSEVELTALSRLLSRYSSKTEAGKSIGVSVQNLNRWEDKGTIPPKWALRIERLTDGEITALEILEENEAIDSGLI